MYKNIGGKIKWMARIYCWIGIVVSVVAGLAVMVGGGGMMFAFRSFGLGGLSWYMVLLGLVVMAAGSFLSWISSFFLYGLGQLIENSDVMANYYRNKRY